MGTKYDFDYIIIGGGPAGIAAALTLVKAKKKVAIVEGRFCGGANLLTRDTPYSVALNFSHNYAAIASFPELQNQDLSFSLPSAIHHQNSVICALGTATQKTLNDSNIIRITGFANFLDPHTIAVGDRKFAADTFILATGSHLKVKNIAGSDTVNYLTPDNVIKVRRLPKVALIVGGGATGCQIATYFAELGVRTIIIEKSSRLLPREDKEVSEVLEDFFINRLGITILTNSKVTALEQDNHSKRVIFRTKESTSSKSSPSKTSDRAVRTDCIIMTTGTAPNIAYGLENAGVKYSETGVTVNQFFQTSAKNIYAIGSCVDSKTTTERAEYEGRILANNLIHKSKSLINYHGFIRTINTTPNIAVVGYNEQDLSRLKQKSKRAIVRLNEVPASKIYGTDYGFVKLFANRSLQIIGATIVAPHAELIASEIAVAIRHQLTVFEIASTPHPVNNWSEAVKLAAQKIALKKQATKSAEKTIKHKRK